MLFGFIFLNSKRIVLSQNYLLVSVPWNWLQNAPAGEVVIDPTVQDTWLEDATNHGDRDRLLVGKSTGNPRKRTLIKFDLSGIPAGVELSSADLRLHYYGRGGDLNATWVDRPVSAHKILVDWNELEATTTRRSIDNAVQNVDAIDVLWNASYGQSGTDYSAIAEDTQFITPDYPRWVSWDLKDLTQAWIDGAAENYGVMLLATNEDTDGYDLRFRSSDYTADEQFRPKLEIRWTLATRTTYFLKDHLGTTRAAITDAGDVVGYDDYDPWGLILANRSMTSQPDMPFKYTGKEWDADNGLDWYYFGARYYDPVVGRWNGVDPLAEKYLSLSPYNYAVNNPLLYIDPDGKDIWKNWIYLAWARKKSQAIADKKHIEANRVASRLGGIEDGRADAWRHASWSKESSEAIGKFLTFVFGLIHEAENLIAGDSSLEAIGMDLTNNKKGRSIANMDVDVEGLAKDEELKTLSPSNDATYEGESDEILQAGAAPNSANSNSKKTKKWVAADVWKDKDGNFNLRSDEK